MAGRESRERPASGAARDYRLKRFELKTENRSRNNGSGQRFIASNGDSRHPTAEFRLNGRGVDKPTFLTSDGNPEGTPHVLRIPTFRRLVSEGRPRPHILYRIPETGSGS